MTKIVIKTMFLFILGMACIFTASGQTAVELDAAIKQAGRDISLKLAMGPKVAVLNFTSPVNDLSEYVLKELTLTLEKSKSSTILSRQLVDRALSEVNLKPTSGIGDATALQIGKKLGAQYIITGSFEKSGENFSFRTRLILVTNGSVQASTTLIVKNSALVTKLLGTDKPVTAPVTTPTSTPATTSIPATTPTTAPVPVLTPATSQSSATAQTNQSANTNANQTAPDNVDKTKWNVALLDTARNVTYLSNLEKDVILEMNMVRSDPKKYAELYINPSSGASAKDCYQELSKTESRSLLQPKKGLSLAAKDHVADTGPKGIIGHTGSDGSSMAGRINRYGTWKSGAGENISYGYNTARAIVVQLLVDDGVPDRGHRKNIMNKNYKYAGVGAGSHTKYSYMCVQDFADDYIDK